MPCAFPLMDGSPMDIYMTAGVKYRWSRRVHVGNPCRFRPTTRPSVATPAAGPIQSVPERFSTRREMVPGQKGGVCWPHGALGGRPAPENQGRDLGIERAYFGARGALFKIPLRLRHARRSLTCRYRARIYHSPLNSLK